MKRILCLASLVVACSTPPKSVAAPEEMEVIPLQFASAEEIARELDRASFHATADPRTNSLLVQATHDDLTRVRVLIEKLDLQVK